MSAERVICTWAMGVTQHVHSVATIREIANFMFLRGNVGRPGAGLCPVRGHSNVQGDRTVGINEKPAEAFLDALEKQFGVAIPRREGHNVLAAIGAMLDGSAQAFIGLGGNFARATPDSALVEKALRRLKLTVNIATKPNHSHLMPGETSFILPCLGRTEIDLNTSGQSQLISVEDSMSMVHGSAGINRPASSHLLSEVAIIAGIAQATVGSTVVDWEELAEDYDLIRGHIEATIDCASRAAFSCAIPRRIGSGIRLRARPRFRPVFYRRRQRISRPGNQRAASLSRPSAHTISTIRPSTGWMIVIAAFTVSGMSSSSTPTI